VNLYGFTVNDGVNWVDILGRVGLFSNNPSHGTYNDALQNYFDQNRPDETDAAIALAIIEIWIPISAGQALAEGRYLAVAGEFVLGKVKIIGKIPGVEKFGSECCIKVKATIQWFKNPRKRIGGDKADICHAETPTVTLHHNGDLKDGQVSPSRPLSTSTTPVDHYHPDAPTHQFDVPQNKFDEWFENFQVEFYKDMKAGTNEIVEEIRILPPASGELNNFKK
jgi:hypothetical protein